MNKVIRRVKRDQTIIVKLTEEEKNAIQVAAYSKGETMSNYIRKVLVYSSHKADMNG